jgi:hypothetical protein
MAFSFIGNAFRYLFNHPTYRELNFLESPSFQKQSEDMSQVLSSLNNEKFAKLVKSIGCIKSGK